MLDDVLLYVNLLCVGWRDWPTPQVRRVQQPLGGSANRRREEGGMWQTGQVEGGCGGVRIRSTAARTP